MAEKNENNKKSSATNYADYLKRKLAEQTEKQKKTDLPSPERLDGKESSVVDVKAVKESKADPEVKPKEESNVNPLDAKWKETIKNDNRSKKNIQTRVEEKPEKKNGALLKRLGIIALSAVLVVALVVGGYFCYLQIGYSRLEDMRYLATMNNQASRVQVGRTYSISTFNIGFGAYGQSFSFFMDEGELMNGTKTKGKSARASSEEDVLNNISGAVSLIKNKAQSDFYFFQEVDTDSTRSYYVNQVDLLQQNFAEYASVYAENSHSDYLFYPLNDPIGKINSGILTMSRFNIDYSVRRKLDIETGMIDKLFDLDRCFTVTKLPVAGTDKFLVLVNVHLSAYDDGGIREAQIAMLYNFMAEEAKKENYVIVGGDFNLSLAGDAGVFNNDMKTPLWCKNLPEAYSAEKFKEIGSNINYDISSTIGTCRDASMKYTEGINLEVVIDGFITSSNVSVVTTSVVDGDFKNSDHNPVRMEFKLN